MSRSGLSDWLRAAAIAGRNVLVGGNVRSLSLLRQPRRLVQYAGESLFLYKTLTGARELPQRTVPEAFPGRGPQEVVLAGITDESWVPPVASYTVDLVALCLLCRYMQPEVVFEIGTLNGYSAYHFALNAPQARVHTLDLPKDAAVPLALPATILDHAHIAGSRTAARYCFEGTAEADRIECLFGDSASFDYSPFHGRVDLFFIDGSHSYEYVKSDTEQALRCCRPGGVIAWHDYGRMGVNGVSRYLAELRRDGYDVFAVPGGSVAFLRVDG
jgi:predicted O-methyltransferase YrrM